jgi:PAS domain-containing protein
MATQTTQTPQTNQTSQMTKHSSFARPDERREFPKGHTDIVKVGSGEVGRLVFQPGWRWSKDVKAIARTASCEAPHFQYHVSGRLAIRMDDGTEFIAGPGDVTSLPKGHDAWVVGDEPAVVVDWFGASHYALPPGHDTDGKDGHTAGLRALATDLQDMADESPQAMYIFLDDRNKWCNRRFASLLGYASPQEWAAVADSFTSAFVDPKSQSTIVSTYQQAMEQGRGSQVPVTWRRKDGKPVKTRVILVPVEREGHRMALHFITPE